MVTCHGSPRKLMHGFLKSFHGSPSLIKNIPYLVPQVLDALSTAHTLIPFPLSSSSETLRHGVCTDPHCPSLLSPVLATPSAPSPHATDKEVTVHRQPTAYSGPHDWGDSEGERGRRLFSSIVVAVMCRLQQTQVCAVARLCMRLAQFSAAF